MTFYKLSPKFRTIPLRCMFGVDDWYLLSIGEFICSVKWIGCIYLWSPFKVKNFISFPLTKS